MILSWGGVFLPLGTSLTFLYFFFFRDASWTRILAWTMKVSWVLGVFAIGNVINVSFSFFFFRGHFLDLDFGLGYDLKLGWCFFYIGNVINVPLLFFL